MAITTRAIWIVAVRDITPGKELTYNYGYGVSVSLSCQALLWLYPGRVSACV